MLRKVMIAFVCLGGLILQAAQTTPVPEDRIDRMVHRFLNELPQESDRSADISSPMNDKAQSGYYIQMGAFHEGIPQELMQKLRQKGYRVALKRSVRQGVQTKLLLVGPYLHKEEARRALGALRSVVAGAFITH